MKVKVLRPFLDLETGVERKAGEEFECAKERFEQISAQLPEWVEAAETKTPAKTTRAKTTRKTASKKA